MESKGIYKIINTFNDKVYIGSANNIKQRWQRHRYSLKAGTHENQHLQRAWIKYGQDAFQFTIVELTDDLLERELFWIKEYDCVLKGYNILSTPGKGRLGLKHTLETIKKMSESKRGHTYNVGRKHPKEYGEAITKRQLGTKMSDEAKLKMSLAKKGRTLSEEHKAQISASLLKRALEREHNA